MELEGTVSEWQSRFGGREWRVTEYGIVSRTPGEVGEERHRTDGQPLTVTRYLTHWLEPILRISEEEGVPVPLILATLATENGPARIVDGTPWVRPPRKEPGYVSDRETPHLISVGPTHTLISTARWAMGEDRIDRGWLMDLENNLRAGFRALVKMGIRWKHDMDPILAAATYNSGGIYDASRPESRFHNRWHLRSWGNHLDRVADWYGDAAYVWRDQVTEPAEDDLTGPDQPDPHDPQYLPRPREVPRPEPTSRPLPARLWGRVRSLVPW
jgi:peptidoglycan LD-endopeptidase CwlK